METWSKKVKTRKIHRCWGCMTVYPAGELMSKVSTVDRGRFSNGYWCSTCELVIDELEDWQKEDGFAEGDIKDMYPERWAVLRNRSALIQNTTATRRS